MLDSRWCQPLAFSARYEFRIKLRDALADKEMLRMKMPSKFIHENGARDVRNSLGQSIYRKTLLENATEGGCEVEQDGLGSLSSLLGARMQPQDVRVHIDSPVR